MLASGMLAVLLALVSEGAPADAPAAAPPTPTAVTPPARGLTPFRFQLDARFGLGGLWVSGDGQTIVAGTTLPLGVTAGLSLTKALVAFAEISDTHMLLFDSSTSNGAGSFDLYGAGLGLKFYLTQKDWVSVSASLARLQLQQGTGDMDISHWGAMGRVSGAHEWPVSPTWSVGVGGEYQLGSMRSGGLSGTATIPLPVSAYEPSGLSMLLLASFHQAAEQAEDIPPAGADRARFAFHAEARGGIGALWPRVGHGYWITGASTPLSASVGVGVTKNVIAFADLSDLHMFGPAANDNSQRLYSVDVYGAGLGLKVYLTPRAFFVEGAGSLARLHYEGLTYTNFALSETSHWGVVGRVAAGREWAVSPSWSLGAAGELQLGTMKTSASFENNNYGSDAFTLKGLALLGLATFSPAAAADESAVAKSAAPAGFHAHDGFYANVSLGPAWTWVNTRRQQQLYADPDYRLSGRGTRLAVSLGYAFARKLVAFAEFSELQVHDPDLRIDDPDGPSDIGHLAWYGVGPGVRYYLMPANVFLSASVLASRVEMYNGTPDDSRYGIRRSSGWGATGQLAVGKEWWVASELGIGLCAEFGLGKLGGADIWLPYTVKTASALASVSFN